MSETTRRVRIAPAEIARVPLTGNPLDRSDSVRGRPDRVAALLDAPDARAMAIWRGKPAIDLSEDAPRLAWTRPEGALRRLGSEPPALLGRADGAGRFVIDLSEREEEAALAAWPGASKFIDVRSIAGSLQAGEAAILAEAKSLTDWRRAHPRCSRCGAAVEMAMAGWRSDCPACGATHFPRTDPVVIMLVLRRTEDGDEKVLIGRQANWPERMHSLLAGYIEPGETVEEAVRRETFEEAGVRVGAVTYVASQPWPFPSTLMLGCAGEALDDALNPDFDELEACRWATRAEMATALKGEHPEFDAPRRDAIARVLTEAWVSGRVGL